MTPVYLFPPRTRQLPGYSTSPRQRAAGPHHLHVVYQQGAPSSSRRGESSMVPGPDCMEDGRMCANGIHHAALGWPKEETFICSSFGMCSDLSVSRVI